MSNTNDYTNKTQVLALTEGCGVSPRLFEALLAHFGTLEEIFRAEQTEFESIENFPAKIIRRLDSATRKLPKAQRTLDSLTEREIGSACWFDREYPAGLRELHDPPPIIFFRGSLPDPEKKLAAVVGASEGTAEGMELTARVVKEVSTASVQLVSSLGGSIDSSVHLAAKAAEGISFAMLNCGFDQIDQTVDVPVAIDIAQTGGVITELMPSVAATATTTSQSDRLIAAMPQAVVVTEAYEDSHRTLDILKSCHEIGKLAFLLIDPESPSLFDEKSLAHAVKYGALPLEGVGRIEDIIKSLV